MGSDIYLGTSQRGICQRIESLGTSSWVGMITSFGYEMSLAAPWAFGLDCEERKWAFYDDGETKMQRDRKWTITHNVPGNTTRPSLLGLLTSSFSIRHCPRAEKLSRDFFLYRSSRRAGRVLPDTRTNWCTPRLSALVRRTCSTRSCAPPKPGPRNGPSNTWIPSSALPTAKSSPKTTTWQGFASCSTLASSSRMARAISRQDEVWTMMRSDWAGKTWTSLRRLPWNG